MKTEVATLKKQATKLLEALYQSKQLIFISEHGKPSAIHMLRKSW